MEDIDDEKSSFVNRYNYMTQHEVAEIMGMTRSQVDTLEKLALRKLRNALSVKNYKKEDLF
jgi:DNA-directed RNA polymerase specialized sigma subunit